jgi:hypothetical protein
MSAKYRSLANFLQKSGQELIRMNFQQVEDLIRGELPSSAREYRAWWSNSNTHSHARHGWLAAGYETSKVDLDQEELIFIKTPQELTYLEERPKPKQMMAASLSVPPSPKSDPADMLRTAGGRANAGRILEAVRRYVYGEITELELGRLLRQLWPR